VRGKAVCTSAWNRWSGIYVNQRWIDALMANLLNQKHRRQSSKWIQILLIRLNHDRLSIAPQQATIAVSHPVKPKCALHPHEQFSSRLSSPSLPLPPPPQAQTGTPRLAPRSPPSPRRVSLRPLPTPPSPGTTKPPARATVTRRRAPSGSRMTLTFTSGTVLNISGR
jgi:hypothetical protein